MAKTTDAHTGHVRESSGRVTTDAGREGGLSVNGGSGQASVYLSGQYQESGLCVSHGGDVLYEQQPKAAGAMGCHHAMLAGPRRRTCRG